MDELDEAGRRLLEWLVGKLDAIEPDDPSTYVSYRDAHNELGLDLQGPTDGTSLQKQGLDSLAEWSKETGKPAITGLVINRGTLEPGPGYFKLFGKTTTDYAWWAEQVRRSKVFDWTPYLGGRVANQVPTGEACSAPATAPPTPEASDLTPPPRVEVTTYRVLRDSEVSRRVKLLHNHECQICGHTIVLPDGSRYAEAHHIQPLGGTVPGPDVTENVLCVCPNHHAELDLGLWDIDLGSLRTAPGHRVEARFVDYHNHTVRGRWT